MEKSFWEDRWNTNKIGFHGQINHFLTKYFNELSLKENDRIFLPLCGKTLDIHWLLSKKVHVIGVEFVETAIEQLFQELNVKPEIKQAGPLKHYSAKNIDIFVGDFFNLKAEHIGDIQAVYDRAAIVALPKESRVRYAKHLVDITHKARQLLVTFEYDQSIFEGPPMSVTKAEVEQHYSSVYKIKLCEEGDVEGGIRGTYPAKEAAWLLTSTR